jgi:hypothetical protein
VGFKVFTYLFMALNKKVLNRQKSAKMIQNGCGDPSSSNCQPPLVTLLAPVARRVIAAELF